MGKQRSGQLTDENASPRTPRPRKHCGALNGFQRPGKMKDLPQQEPIGVSLFTERPLAAEEGDIKLVIDSKFSSMPIMT